uniref:Uncharacterized protein n=1 Tax=Globisporangium ultimum (strain ATCC 200006 / CBS 805.95 / DAOM BR144) TaxID=431595 RepID=K3WH22_GLOUD
MVKDDEPQESDSIQRRVVPNSVLDQSTTSNENCMWLGITGSNDYGEEHINLESDKALFRDTVINDIIDCLEWKNVILRRSPLMAGKTSTATLASRASSDKRKRGDEKIVIVNFSALAFVMDFTAAFEAMFGVTWHDMVTTIASRCMAYVIVDDVHVVYQEAGASSPPRTKLSVFWNVVKDVMSDQSSRVRMLLFAAYDTKIQHTQFSTPVRFADCDIVLGIQYLNFSHDEIVEYAKKGFDGFQYLVGSSINGTPAIEVFCANLEYLTGRHVGFCVRAIDVLHREYASKWRSGSRLPTANELVRNLQDGSLFKALRSARSVAVLNTLNDVHFDRLARLFQGVIDPNDDETIQECLRRGILVECDSDLEFSPPTMSQFFMEKLVGRLD